MRLQQALHKRMKKKRNCYGRTPIETPMFRLAAAATQNALTLFKDRQSSALLMATAAGLQSRSGLYFISVGSKAVASGTAPGIIFGQYGETGSSMVENCQRFPSEEAFWSKYSTSDSTHLRYQQILDALKGAREL
ncbi:hypothetical protein C8J57DRAFT_1246642 [Mycena rebaudengoi]|nr:hypothetical protein C8J57DRAFT_1246642 [Mycena rebaudengoi]